MLAATKKTADDERRERSCASRPYAPVRVHGEKFAFHRGCADVAGNKFPKHTRDENRRHARRGRFTLVPPRRYSPRRVHTFKCALFRGVFVLRSNGRLRLLRTALGRRVRRDRPAPESFTPLISSAMEIEIMTVNIFITETVRCSYATRLPHPPHPRALYLSTRRDLLPIRRVVRTRFLWRSLCFIRHVQTKKCTPPVRNRVKFNVRFSAWKKENHSTR